MVHKRTFSGRRRLTTDEAALKIYESLDTPVSLSCWILLRNKEYRQLIEKSVHPSSYCLFYPRPCQQAEATKAELARQLAERFRRDYQAVSLLSKIDREIGIDKQATALQKWWEAEESNRATNNRLRLCYDASTGVPYRHPDYRPHAEHLHHARKIIAQILGRFRWSEAARHFGFGPGVTRQTKGQKVDLSRKFAGTPAITPRAFSFAALTIGLTPSWYESLTGVTPDGPCSYLGIVADDAVSVNFVPKNAKTFRAIGVEPLMAIYLQKGVGAVIRNRLKRVGINLDSQLVNQAGAFLASLGNDFVTLDLSSASDTVALELVRDLLPHDWFEVLNALRCANSEVPSGPSGSRITHRNEKFSSMGNGYTFELESLIFYALSRAVEDCRGASNEVLVYGDDIIVHRDTAVELVPLLTFCGFTVNKAKSFMTGYFYESCGKDFFLGYDVRPFFIRKELKDVEDYFTLYNQCMASDRNRDRPYRTPLYGHVSVCIYHSVRPKFRFVVPPHWGDDTGFRRYFDEAHPSFYSRRGWGVFRFPYWQPVPASVKRTGLSAKAAKLARLSATTADPDSHPGLAGVTNWLFPDVVRCGNDFSVREDRVSRRRIGVGYTHTWD